MLSGFVRPLNKGTEQIVEAAEGLGGLTAGTARDTIELDEVEILPDHIHMPRGRSLD